MWFHPTPHKAATNFRAAHLQGGAGHSRGGSGKTQHGLGEGDHVIFDRSYRELARFPAGGGLAADLHEFLVTPEGTALVAAWEIREVDLSSSSGHGHKQVVEGVVQELEIPTARVLFEWRSLDHVAVDETYAGVGSLYDYFHINSIELDADGDFLVSARNTWAVYKIARRDGNVVWRLGGKRSDFELGKGAHFAWQHDARHHGSGSELTIFDNGDSPQIEPQSRALTLSLDLSRKRASLLHAYTHTPPVLAHIFGSVQTQPNGNVVVGWGASPYFTGSTQPTVTCAFRREPSPGRGELPHPPLPVERPPRGATEPRRPARPASTRAGTGAPRPPTGGWTRAGRPMRSNPSPPAPRQGLRDGASPNPGRRLRSRGRTRSPPLAPWRPRLPSAWKLR